MPANAELMTGSTVPGQSDVLLQMLAGYRFTVCADPGAVARALDVRRRVYVDKSGYSVPVPDEYDRRSWFLLAEHVESGLAVGSMRVTPRAEGPLEAEEYFTLPRAVRTPKAFELNRFAILPEHRKGKTFLPIVSVGLFKLVVAILERVDAHWMVIASKPERIWTYEWLGFRHTGLSAPYGKLDFAPHELLLHDFRNREAIRKEQPFFEFLVDARSPEVVMPRTVPSLALAADFLPEQLPLRKSA
jgi:N-acyl-L-homoserine lactone synthetase